MRVKYEEWEDVCSFTSFNAGGTADNQRIIRPGIQSKVFRGFFVFVTNLRSRWIAWQVKAPESIKEGEFL